MSAKKIDELFRSKLEGHAGVPSPDAWARLQTKMTPANEKKAGVWWYVAAAIPLLLVAGWFLFLPGKGELTTSGTLAEKKTETNAPTGKEKTDTQLADVKVPTQDAQDTGTEPAKGAETKSAQQQQAVATAVTRKKTQKPVQPADTQVASADQNNATQMETLVAIEEINKVEEVNEEVDAPAPLELNEGNLVATVEEPVEAPEVKITFIADDEDDKFLDPVRELIASELPKEKKNGFGKLVASARSFSNRDILSELRDSKDDLFNGGMKRSNVKNEKGQ